MKLDVQRDGNAVGVWFTANVFTHPAAFGPTLADALRNLADQLEEHNCNLIPRQLNHRDDYLLDWMQNRRLQHRQSRKG